MFESEIRNQQHVELYDLSLSKLASGTITSYNAKNGYVTLDFKVSFPIALIAKIKILQENIANNKHLLKRKSFLIN